ncbi:rhamnulokinase [Proteiniphilum sp. UBA1028]|jgi:rhamnulokinase|uniref:rhamnulokinase n=1 Tax=Proteiniphilum sp. UBA1028 TaxID=1947251 RepID=UPI000E83E2C3|nr:rhamnulokinase [Proteiniphilum sp. UBA1028]HBG57141.1 rhamnulokinase [Porphyromonadaceae bacterium]
MSEGNLISFLAIDLGASSGRAMLGTVQNDRLELKEILRFPNPMVEVNGRLYWNLLYLYNQILASLRETKVRGHNLVSIGIDTWGVDFVCFGTDGEPLRMPYSYRDSHTQGAPERFFSKVPKEKVYEKTGIQIMNFNSLFQLDTLLEKNSSIYPLIDKILFMPDALSYLLTGRMVTEYTIASTSQMINPYTKDFEPELLDAIRLSKEKFAPIVLSGTTIGKISPSVQHQTGQEDISVIAVAGHDTASAVLAVPADSAHFAYLSSGTWSLMGIESGEPVINDNTFALNFTNEGGADGSIRLLKNICGMWLIEQCKKEWEKKNPVTYEEIVKAAEQASPFQSFINPDASCFASPASMIEAIQNYCRQTGQPVPCTIGEIARCIYESLAFRYKQVLQNLQELANFPIEKLHIIGGGSKNNMLNTFTANAIGLPVVAGPSEATAFGNLLMQAKAAGLVTEKDKMRHLVRNSVELEIFTPSETSGWQGHYPRYLNVYREIQ